MYYCLVSIEHEIMHDIEIIGNKSWFQQINDRIFWQLQGFFILQFFYGKDGIYDMIRAKCLYNDSRIDSSMLSQRS